MGGLSQLKANQEYWCRRIRTIDLEMRDRPGGGETIYRLRVERHRIACAACPVYRPKPVP